MKVTLLGPQRRPTLDTVVADLDPQLRFATVTAGWQEREPDDQELNTLLGGRSTNLELYGRWLDIQQHDEEFAIAELEHRTFLEELRLLYLVQLGAATDTIQVLARRNGDRPEAIDAAVEDAWQVIRLVDDNHVARVRASEAEFVATYNPSERPAIAGHRAAVHDLLGQAAGLVVTGGHVGVLLRMLRLFGIADAVPEHVIAWSAGAMALTDRVVLFHDRTPQGVSPSEIYDDGLGLLPDLVLLPHARRRLRTDDPVRMASMARRFAPARCVVLDDGMRLDLDDDGALPVGARVIDDAGHVSEIGAAA